MRIWLLFFAGVVLGLWLSHAAEAQGPLLMFGSNSGTATVVAVDASGNVSVAIQ